jgi:hypothetical protein
VTRLTAEFWVSAYLQRLSLAGIPAFITAKGDPTAGAVLVKQVPLTQNAIVYQRSFDLEGKRIWVVLADGLETNVDAVIAQQRKFDPDLWVVEVEDRDGRHLLDESGLGD